MQVDPIKPTLKAPGAEHLKLKCDILLSNFAFKFNLRRYTKAFGIPVVVAINSFPTDTPAELELVRAAAIAAGAYTRPLFSLT